MTSIGVLGTRVVARVDGHGAIQPDSVDWRLDWWIGADDRWRLPERETAVRQAREDDVPIVRTAMRVPGGDAVASAYGIGGPGGLLAVDVENASPAPFVVAFVVRGARTLALDGATVLVDGRPGLVMPRAPSRWAVARGSTQVEVCSGNARSGAFAPVKDRAGRLEGAFLQPVPHRVSLRAAMATASFDGAVDLGRMPTAADAARGWRAHLERGMRIELPNEHLLRSARTATGEVLLRAQRRAPVGADAAALEDWGFDDEARDAWQRLSGRERRRAAARPDAATLPDAADADADPAAFLLALRGALVHDGDTVVTVLPQLPPTWRGAPVEVHDAPTRRGRVSFAVRWHGSRPALLWDAPAGVTLRAPGLDPTWSSDEPSGEALLASGNAA